MTFPLSSQPASYRTEPSVAMTVLSCAGLRSPQVIMRIQPLSLP